MGLRQCCYSQRKKTTILNARLKNKKSGARRRSWAPDLTTRRAAHDDDRLWVPSTPQEHSNHVSTSGQATSYDRSDWWSNVTTDRESIDNYPIIRVTPWWDSNNEARRIIMIGHNNREAINSSSKYSAINRSMTIKCGFSSSNRTPP
jgi:hypothetical protein